MGKLMVVKLRNQGPVVLVSHPEGCRIAVQQKIDVAQRFFADKSLPRMPQTLGGIIAGGTTGYGIGTAIALLEAAKRAGTTLHLSVIGFEKEPSERAGKLSTSPGYYAALALAEAYPNAVKVYFADAFDPATKNRVLGDMAADSMQVGFMLHSVVATKRNDGQQLWTSALKVIGEPLTANDMSFDGRLVRKTVEAVKDPGDGSISEDITGTVKVMGSEDPLLWHGAITSGIGYAPNAQVRTYSYYGPKTIEGLQRMYAKGTIGVAKANLLMGTREIDERLRSLVNGSAEVDVLPFVRTGASFGIPLIVAYDGVLTSLGINGVPAEPIVIGGEVVYSAYGPINDTNLSATCLRQFDHQELSVENEARARWEEFQALSQGDQVPAWMLRSLETIKSKYFSNYGFDIEGVDESVACEVSPDRPPNVIDLMTK